MNMEKVLYHGDTATRRKARQCFLLLFVALFRRVAVVKQGFSA